MSQMSFDDLPAPDDASVPDDLYIVGEGEGSGVVKIGRARDPVKRLSGIQTGNPNRLFILHVEPGAGPLERPVHYRLARQQLIGEWFDLGAQDPVAEVLRLLGEIRKPAVEVVPVPAPLVAKPKIRSQGDMLTPDETAWELSMGVRALAKMRKDGDGPAWSLTEDGIRYKRGDLDLWLEKLMDEQHPGWRDRRSVSA